MIDPSVLEYSLSDSAGGLWRRLWSLGYNPPLPRDSETARQWLDRVEQVREIVKEINIGKNIGTDTHTQTMFDANF
ncbi:hypothetical protein [Methylophaga sp.]|uniref:hypothetical protein n=1 Tax=Methylophaga sp. TaxID=2024840 RepID=UPI0013FE93FA|nr:hypothetical protein [Methylophaga sp.]MTI64402.1 hypothetical protein [Methylophaga sp.]